MPLTRSDLVAQPGTVVVASEAASSSSFAGSFAAPIAFFSAWVAVGLLGALFLRGRGHDLRLLLRVGIGLGPLMLAMAWDVTDGDRQARPLELDPGRLLEGSTDVLVWVQGRPDDILEVVPTVRSIGRDIRTLTIARAVPYEWIDESEGPEIGAVKRDLNRARELAGVRDAALVAWPGRVDAATASFLTARPGTLVLHPQGGHGHRPAG